MWNVFRHVMTAVETTIVGSSVSKHCPTIKLNCIGLFSLERRAEIVKSCYEYSTSIIQVLYIKAEIVKYVMNIPVYYYDTSKTRFYIRRNS